MDEVGKSLTPQERALLSNLWEDRDTLKALGSALSHQQLILAQQTLEVATGVDQVMFLRGQNYTLKWIMSFLRDNHKNVKESQKQRQLTVDKTTASSE